MGHRQGWCWRIFHTYQELSVPSPDNLAYQTKAVLKILLFSQKTDKNRLGLNFTDFSQYTIL